LEPINLYDFESRAKSTVPHNVWDYISRGSQDGIALKRNRSMLESILLRPRFLRDVRKRNLSTTILGEPIKFPIMIAPASSQTLVHPDGEIATARAAATAGTKSIETVAAAASGPLWFQLFHCGKDQTEDLVKRAEDSGYKAICLTVDTPIPSDKEVDIRNNWQLPPEAYRGNFSHNTLTDIPSQFDSGISEGHGRPPTIPLTFEQLPWLKSLTRLPLVIKGIRTAEDAALCVEYDVDGIVVSNHGGRQIDCTLSSIETLPEVVAAVNGKAEIYFDSGVRRGSDVLKALALGAKGVLIGRPIFWGLAVNGQAGVEKVLDILYRELDLVLAYCGFTSVDQIDDAILHLPVEMEYSRIPYVEEIRGLADLHSKGLISRKEFDSKRESLLGIEKQ
jgi:4-hydroxymandelate oxidase